MPPEKISNLYDIFVNYFIYEYIYMFQFVHLAKEVGEMDELEHIYIFIDAILYKNVI